MGKKYTEDELNSCSKEMLVTLLLSMQDQMERLNQSMENLIEQIAISNQQRFGRSSEKGLPLEGQLHLFNEVEAIMDTLYVPELFFASTFWTKVQVIFGHCCMSNLDKVASGLQWQNCHRIHCKHTGYIKGSS